jgi:LPXTG-motif cell wall-anchored protein
MQEQAPELPATGDTGWQLFYALLLILFAATAFLFGHTAFAALITLTVP